MAYDRYDNRREGRQSWRGDDRDFRRERGFSDRDRDERGWFERAGDEIASWFGDDDDRGQRRERSDRFSSHLRNEDDVRSYSSDRDR